VRHFAEGLIRDVYAAGVSHVTVLFRRIDDAWPGAAPISSCGKRHGGINESIAKLRGDYGGEVMSNEHMLSERHTGPILFSTCGVVNRRGLACGYRVTHFSPRHIFDQQRVCLRCKGRTQHEKRDRSSERLRKHGFSFRKGER
jgi:hypothetical protein